MKINKFKNSAIGKSQGTSSSSAAKNVGNAKGSSQSNAAKKASVNVSSSGDISATLAQDAAQRAEKVASLKMEVESGNYQHDSEQTANKLIENLTDYSLA